MLGKAGVNGVRRTIKRGKNLARYSLPLVKGLARKATKGGGCALWDAPRTRFNQKISSHRIFEGVDFDLSEVKAIKNSVPEVTVNDVMVAVVSGALRRYLSRKGELPEKSMTAALPVNIAPDRGALAPGGHGNHISFVFPKIYTNEADPVKRLQAISRANTAAKNSSKNLGGGELMDTAGLVPAAITGTLARSFVKYDVGSKMPPLFNTIITNVMGASVAALPCRCQVAAFFMGQVSVMTPWGRSTSYSVTTTRSASVSLAVEK